LNNENEALKVAERQLRTDKEGLLNNSKQTQSETTAMVAEIRRLRDQVKVLIESNKIGTEKNKQLNEECTLLMVIIPLDNF
jgi:hypothetical protein